MVHFNRTENAFPQGHDNPEIWLPLFRPRRESEACQGACDRSTADLYWIDGSRFDFGVHNTFSMAANEMCFTYQPSGGGVIRGSQCIGAVASKRAYVCEFSCYAVPLLVRNMQVYTLTHSLLEMTLFVVSEHEYEAVLR